MDLKQAVPWGRDFDEYCEMFGLSSLQPGDSVLGCGDGPASFNKEATARGIRVTSVDPLYAFERDDLERRIEQARDEVIPQLAARLGDYVWRVFANPDELERRRMSAMRLFLDDYVKGCAAGRYVNAGLPDLPFEDKAFDYGLCSHLLFLYSPQLDEEFHVRGMLELCRVARQVRVYPLVSIQDNERSPHLPAVLAAIEGAGYRHDEIAVTYEFQKGATTMLHIIT